MSNDLDDAIADNVQSPSPGALEALDKVFLNGELLIPVGAPVTELEPGRFDIPVICIRTEEGTGAIPAFSTMDHLFKWKPLGCDYVPLAGRKLLTMAVDMDGVSEILVNPNDVPRGRIPRSDFRRMLTIAD